MPETAGLADWINAYNAAVVYGIVRHAPVDSVMSIEGFFKKATYKIAGEDRTLDEVEHRVIRHRFKDARIHVALNCGARSCPPLYGRAFRAKDIDATLGTLVESWLADPRHVRVDGQVLYVSEIFFWFREDFEREAASIASWIDVHRTRGKGEVAKTNKVKKLNYDWRLNAKR